MLSFFRFLFRNKLYSLINFVGLAVSLAFVVIIFSYSTAQMRISRSLPDYENVYGLLFDNETVGFYGAYDMVAALPEVESITRSDMPVSDAVVSCGENKYLADMQRIDKHWLDIVGTKVLSGDAELLGGNNVIVSESFARRMFGDEDPLARTFSFEDDELSVVAVVEDTGEGFGRRCDIYTEGGLEMDTASRYAFNMFLTMGHLVRVVPGTDVEALEDKIQELFKDYPYIYGKMSLVRSDKLYFHEGNSVFNHGNSDSIKSLFAAALLLMVLALLNYINLNTALVGKRANEMATRRLLGSSRGSIVGKYIAESGIFTLICFAAALGLAAALTPTVNSLICDPLESPGSDAVRIRDIFTAWNIAVYLLICAVVSALAGLIPALMAARISPIDTIKGATRQRRKMYLSRVFIVVQNVISVTLIAVSITMELQYKHLMDRPIGADIEDVYMIYSTIDDSEELVERLKALPCVEAVGRVSGSVPGRRGQTETTELDEAPDGTLVMSTADCDTTALRILGYRIAERFGEDTEGSKWVSKRTFALIGKDWQKPEDREFFESKVLHGMGTVSAVIDDFLVVGLSSDDSQIGAVFTVSNSPHYWYYAIKTRGDHESAGEAIAACERDFVIERTGLGIEPYQAGYLSDLIAESEDEARRNLRLLEFFMAISILLSLSGLVAISIHFSDMSTKSIALHKVYGATTSEETVRNLRSYLATTFVAYLLAVPLAVILCTRYLQGFSYRMDLSPWIFVLTLAISLLITFVSVILQVRRAASVNPAMALKAE